MDLEEQKNRLLVFTSIILMMIILAGGFYFSYTTLFNEEEVKQEPSVVKPVTEETGNYNVRLIKEINKNEKSNYLISPYSIEIALSMLRDGCNGETRKQIEDLIGDREINYFNSKGKINVANGVFVNEKYKNDVLDSYYNTVKNKYNSDIVYDKFESPDVVNNWVKKETYDMIPKLLSKLEKQDLLVLVNALAIDTEWEYQFDSDRTYEQDFTKKDGTKYKVKMMHESFEQDVKYFKTNDAEGVILPYAKYDNNNRLEFVGILPNDKVNGYVSNLTVEELNKIDKNTITADEEEKVVLSLPKFKYDYKIDDFVSNLENLGIKKVFEDGNADLSKMINISSHVSDVIHKTHIEVKEKGTKAAAATAVVVTKDTASAPGKSNNHIVEFNKPFVYMIRDKKTKEILFFGVVYEPNK